MIKITYSNGRGKSGKQYAYIRPDGNFRNKSIRVEYHKVNEAIARHFPIIVSYLIDGIKIGAKDERSAIKEYYRICERAKIGKPVKIEKQ